MKMKYKEGDLVKIKSKTWWDKQPKHIGGDAIFNMKGGETVYFFKHMAFECCSNVGEIVSMNIVGTLPYLIYFGYNSW